VKTGRDTDQGGRADRQQPKGVHHAHSHLTLEERTSNEVFVAMAMSCRKVAVYPGRSHTSACRELRQGSSKSGSCARNARHRTPKKEQCRAMTAVQEPSGTGHLPRRKAAHRLVS